MPRTLKWEVGVCILLLFILTSCTKAQLPRVMEIIPMTSLDGGLQSQYSPLSPVMQDVYDRSIPEEVYSGE